MPRRLPLAMMAIATASLLILPGCRGFLTYRIAEAPSEHGSQSALAEVQSQEVEAEDRAPTDVTQAEQRREPAWGAATP